jgi:DNA polymerase elongation subunit (family B)
MEFRLLDFKVYDMKSENGKEFTVQMFGKNEKKESASITVTNIEPFFYVKVGANWNPSTVKGFKKHINGILATKELTDNYNRYISGQQSHISPRVEKDQSLKEYVNNNFKTYTSYPSKGIVDFELVEKHKLYGFDNHAKYNFVKIVVSSTYCFNKIKNIWFDRYEDPTSRFGFSQTLKTIEYRGFQTELYEAKLPPLLRFFHINNISPSGWIKIKKYKTVKDKLTRCDYELTASYDNIIPLREKETHVPFNICSFDIEASSSHGDFPTAIKTYKKLAGELQTHWCKYKNEIQKMSRAEQTNLLKCQIYTCFGINEVPCDGISLVYTKNPETSKDKDYIDLLFNKLVTTRLKYLIADKKELSEMKVEDEDDDEELLNKRNVWGLYVKNTNQSGGTYRFLDCLLDNIDGSKMVDILDKALTRVFSGDNNNRATALEGDKVTFIGSTFLLAGDTAPYLNHGVCLGDCDAVEMKNTEIEIVCCDDERELLLEWRDIINREKPDIILGYNIFGFDYKFMCNRADEIGCTQEFYKIGKNIKLPDTGMNALCKREEKELKIASGSHELTFLNIDGIVQIDLYNYFRREVNLASYKLQDVASHFIGDNVISTNVQTIHQGGELDESKQEIKTEKYTTTIKSSNLMGLQEGNYVIFEIIGHSLDSYNGGKKYKVLDVDEDASTFIVEDIVEMPDGIKMRWGLGKDDVTPADLFHAFSKNGTIDDRTKVGMYCFQDCNLLHNLLRKNDILTGITEIASICYVPIDFIIMRGQGIKLLSFIAKKCSEKETLMPVLEKKMDGGYEGAICLPPKCAFYPVDYVAVVDYSSLYPSCMISENISHDSKVWTKEYDLKGNLVKETGEDKYDNLDGFEYVDIEYDTYDYVSEPGKTKLNKIKIGTKTCRYAQFPDDKKAIMPSILQELLSARKATRTLIKYKTVELKSGEKYSGLLNIDEDDASIKNKNGVTNFSKNDIVKTYDTYNDFMKNVFNQRQLGFKITANSLYGQSGAKTSAFYDKDTAASTTAMGRKLLIYAKNVIEGIFDKRVFDTKHGKVKCYGDVIYGDTDSCFFKFNPHDLGGNKITGIKALEITIELAILAGKLASKFLKAPHDLEYEKTFGKYLLMSKKRYIGMLYELNPHKGKRKAMGLVLKRRDNADIVKDIYGGVIDILMQSGDIGSAVKFTKSFLQNIIDGNVDMKKLIISKALRDWYKIPESIAHKVLADRMGKRDPGNKPAVGSRVPYVYIQTDEKVKLQGDRIEHPDYIKEHNLKPDYGFYITNQIMKPLIQIFALVLEDIPGFKFKLSRFKRTLKSLHTKYKDDYEKIKKEEDKLRNAEVKKLIFEEVLRQANNIKKNQHTIESFFS